MKHFNFIPTIFAAAMLSACGSSDSTSSNEADSIAAIVIPTLEHGNATKKPTSIDSLALYADDLSVPQGIAVLIAYYEIEADAVGRHLQRTAMETRRKFVDVYDILLSNHGNDFRNAIDETASQRFIDLKAAAESYRNLLNGYDESAGLAYISDNARPADSVTTATDSTALHTPAAVADSTATDR